MIYDYYSNTIDTTSWFSYNQTENFTTSASLASEFQTNRYGFFPTLILAVVAGVTSLITITGNLVVILSFILERSIRQPSNYFIASLAVSDLLIGAVSMPFYTAYLLAGQYWLLGEFLCDLWLSVDYSACLCSIYTVFCITVDRFCSVKIPAKYRAWRTNRKILLIIAVIWTIPVLVFFTSIFGWQYFVGERTLKKGECTVQYLQNVIFSTLLQLGYFWVTLVIMSTLYTGIYMVAWRLQKKSEEKRLKIAKLIATTPTTKSQKVFLQRPDELGPSKSEDKIETVRLATEANSLDEDQTPSDPKRLTTSYFGITSSSSMALSSLTESEKSPTVLEEASKLPQLEEKLSHSSRDLTSTTLPTTNVDSKVVFDLETLPGSESRSHTNAAQFLKTQHSAEVKEEVEQVEVHRKVGRGSFSKSDTTETSLSGMLSGAFPARASNNRGSAQLNEDKIRFYVRKPQRSIFSNVRSGKQFSINTEDGSDDDSGNGIDSRNSSIVWKEQKNPPRYGASGDVFRISRVETPAALQEETKFEDEVSSKNRFRPSFVRGCCSFFNRNKVSGETTNPGVAISSSNNNNDDSKPRKHSSRREDRALKALRTITIILGAFLICWTPWHVLTLIMGFCSTCVNSHLYDVSYWLCYLNSPINPFCYAFANKQFKKTFVRIFRLDWQRT